MFIIKNMSFSCCNHRHLRSVLISVILLQTFFCPKVLYTVGPIRFHDAASTDDEGSIAGKPGECDNGLHL